EVAENAGDVLLEHNRFADDRVGVRFAGASPRAVVIGNTFQHDKDAGLWAVRAAPDDPRGGPITVRENRFNADRSGIVAGNIALLVERNQFDQPLESAVHLIGAGAVIRSNNISGSGATGIAAENAHGAIIEANEIEHVTAYAVMVRGSAGVLVRGNRVHNCGYGFGFVLGDPRSPSTAVDNTIIEPRFDGIDVVGDSPILRRNRVLGPRALALHVVDYRPPGGADVPAQPVLDGNNFRANQVQVAADSRTGEAARR
ncbi:MAG TPA: right-handed parallel beta-helix repeat-containing protein, partial [Steroidobacteraceae bacterium]|nr:right-handed parallel beta-helix repeat-containing protein [Steroidobacteraceae bacterium]